MQCELCGEEFKSRECGVCSTSEVQDKIRKVICSAISALTQKTSDEKNRAPIYFLIGHFYRMSGMYDESIQWYEKAIKDDPKADYLRALGTVFVAKGDFQRAVEVLERAVKKAPNYPDYQSDLGAAYFRQGRYEEAMISFREAIRLNPGYANAHNNLAFVYRKKAMFKEADKEIAEAIRLDPAHAVAEYAMGLSYYHGGMFSDFRQPMMIDARSLGDLYYFQEGYGEALACYQKALKVHPRYADIHFCIGQTLLKMNRKKEAREAFVRAVELNPRYEDAQKALTEIERSHD